MSLVVREEGSVPIPEDLAQELGIHKGTEIEWERTGDGTLKLRPRPARKAALDRLMGSLRRTIEPGASGMEEFLRWRQEERELDETYRP